MPARVRGQLGWLAQTAGARAAGGSQQLCRHGQVRRHVPRCRASDTGQQANTRACDATLQVQALPRHRCPALRPLRWHRQKGLKWPGGRLDWHAPVLASCSEQLRSWCFCTFVQLFRCFALLACPTCRQREMSHAVPSFPCFPDPENEHDLQSPGIVPCSPLDYLSWHRCMSYTRAHDKHTHTSLLCFSERLRENAAPFALLFSPALNTLHLHSPGSLNKRMTLFVFPCAPDSVMQARPPQCGDAPRPVCLPCSVAWHSSACACSAEGCALTGCYLTSRSMQLAATQRDS